MPKESKPKATKRETGKRAKKDPDAPKRALSSYMLFAQDQRSVVQSEQPDITFGKSLDAPWLRLHLERLTRGREARRT